MPRLKYPLYLIILLVLIANGCKDKNNHPDEPVSEVMGFPAYKELNDSIRQFPREASLYFRRAMRLSQENAHELAYNDFGKAWSIQPTLENALPYVTNLEILGRHKEKLDLLVTLNNQYPDQVKVGRLLAEAYAVSGKPSRALDLYNKMITRDSLDPETWYEKALLLEQLKDTAEAINALQKAYNFQGVDTYGLELAHLYAEQKNPRALIISDFILKHDSARILIDPFFIKGIYYANVKQYPKAILQFDSCILRDWKTTDAYLEKGRAYFQMENYYAAMQTFNMAITVTNTDPDAYFWLGRSYEALHRKTDAVSNYMKAISLDKDFIEARERLIKLDTGFAHHEH